MKEGWSILRQGLTIETPVPTGIYLGCGHEVGTTSVDGVTVRTLTYNMEEFLGSCVDRYVELAGGDVKLRAVGTPFLHDDQANSYHGRPQPGGASVECPWCKHTFASDHGGARAAVAAPCVLPKALFERESFTFRCADNACGALICEDCGDPSDGVNVAMDPTRDLSDPLPAAPAKTKSGTPVPAESAETGRLQPIAAKVLMKLLYAARLARFDLLRAICHLATYVTRWSSECDRKLHRLVCYVHSTKHLRMIGWVGDTLDQMGPHLYADADFAGCVDTQKSTSGYLMSVRGPRTCFPIVGVSKRQGCVSHSTPEAEMVATDFAVRQCGLPSISLWWTLFSHKPPLTFHEDNQAMIRVIETGRNPTMRHLQRTHRVSVAWLHETFQSEFLSLRYSLTSRMCADIFTKAFTDVRQWGGVCALINTIAPESLPDLIRSEIQQSAPSGGDSTLSDGSSESNCAPALRKSNTNDVVASGASAARHDIVVANSRNVSLVVHDMLERGPHGDYRIGAVCGDEHVCISRE